MVDLLEHCAKFLERAERYEVMGEVFKLAIPIYEQERDFRVSECVLYYGEWSTKLIELDIVQKVSVVELSLLCTIKTRASYQLSSQSVSSCRHLAIH